MATFLVLKGDEKAEFNVAS